MKKALKVIAVVIGTLFLMFVVGFFVLIKNLPSSWQIKQAVSPRSGQNPQFVEKNKPTTAAPEKTLPEKEKPAPRTEEDRADEGKELSQRALNEDFMNDRQPLANVCAYLNHAAESKFLRSDENANSKEFMKRLIDANKDPLVESAAPVFRFLFRLPELKNLIQMVEQADVQNADDLMKKAGFYSQLALAAKDIRDSKPQLDQMLMKTYNMYILSKAVAKHPELAHDPSTLGFCEQIEKNLNMNLEFNADQQAVELQKFLEHAKVAPEEVGYNPGYRSDVKFSFQNSSIKMENVWLEKLFAEDMKKAEKHLDTSTSPPSEN